MCTVASIFLQNISKVLRTTHTINSHIKVENQACESLNIFRQNNEFSMGGVESFQEQTGGFHSATCLAILYGIKSRRKGRNEERWLGRSMDSGGRRVLI